MTNRARHRVPAARGRRQTRRGADPAAVPQPTASRILSAADRLFYGHGIRAVGMEAVAAAAGVTKRTLYHHFASKDELVSAYLTQRASPPVVDRDMPAAAQILRFFRSLQRALASETYRGCAFINAAAELADRSHPAVGIAAAAKAQREAWFCSLAEGAGARDPALLAKQLMILLDGAIANWLVRRDASVAAVAGRSAAALLQAAGAASLPSDG